MGRNEMPLVSSVSEDMMYLQTNDHQNVNNAPKAFINILIFDKDYKFLDVAWQQVSTAAEQIGVSPVVPHQYLMREYTIKEAGYAFVYVSNLSAKASAEADENATLVDVYFACPAFGGDDVTMTHAKGNVIQYNEYYPFGMQTANSWTRENTTGNNFLANGGTELNTTSNLYDLAYRHFDPTLGRMNGVDPMASNYSSVTPYNYSFNDPVALNDPSGADPYATVNYSATNSSYYTTYLHDDRIDYHWSVIGEFKYGRTDAFYLTATGHGRSVAFGGGSWQSSTFAGVPMPGGGGITRDQDGNININWDRIGNRGASWSANGSNGSWSVPNEIFNPWINAWQPYDPHIERLVNRENYRLRYQSSSTNFIFHFNNGGRYSEAHYEGSNWTVSSGVSIENMINVIDANGGMANNIVVVTHGSPSQINLGADVLTKFDNVNSKDITNFNKLTAKISQGGSLLIVACECAQSVAGSLLGKVNTNGINIYMNNDLSSVYRNRGVPFDDNLTLDGNLERGWINLSSTEIFMNMQIGRDGTIRPIPY
jgi:RHS repeat-associated protein